MFVEHPDCNCPSDDTIAYRYMSLLKFLFWLEGSVYFHRSDLFSDPYEGAYPDDAIEIWEKDFKDKQEIFRDIIIPTFRNFPNSCYINCWDLSPYQSDAMWKIYSPNSDGIAIQTTIGRLKKTFSAIEEKVYIGKVSYIDYKHFSSMSGHSLFAPIFHKRNHFENEKELRCLIWKYNFFITQQAINFNRKDIPSGVNIQVNLVDLIETIYIHPNAPILTIHLIQNITKKYGYDFAIKQSDINKMPGFYTKNIQKTLD